MVMLVDPLRAVFAVAISNGRLYRWGTASDAAAAR